jgi:hypothetical protein
MKLYAVHAADWVWPPYIGDVSNICDASNNARVSDNIFVLIKVATNRRRLPVTFMAENDPAVQPLFRDCFNDCNGERRHDGLYLDDFARDSASKDIHQHMSDSRSTLR